MRYVIGVSNTGKPTHLRLPGLKAFSAAELRNSVVGLFSYPGRERNSEFAKLFWLAKLRWLALGFFSILVVPAVAYGYLDRHSVIPYLGLVTLLFFFNLLTHFFWLNKKKQIGSILICFQLAFDLLILSGLLSLTGGFANPFMALFLLHAALGGLLIPGSLAWPFLVLIHTLLAALQMKYVLEFYTAQTGPALLATVIVFHGLLLAFWLVMRSLGSYLERQNERDVRAQVLLEKQDRLRALGALAAGFSHEFASPLNVAKIRLERLLRGPLSAPQKDEVHEAIVAISSCEGVVKQMNSSQMDTRDFQNKKVRVSDLLQDVVESWQGDHADARLRLEISDLGEVILPPVNFAQVVLNLLDNAYESHPRGEISVKLRSVGASAKFAVEDEGPGFSSSVLDKLGEPFNTTKEDGTGLGLYVSQLFVESLGGKLRISNLATGGASVLLDWPLGGERT